MKNLSKILLLSITALFLFSGWAMALTFTFEDTVNYWPGHDNGTSDDSNDQIGTPAIGKMLVTVDDVTFKLQEVKIEVVSRRTFDSLFINLDSTEDGWDGWNYFVRDARKDQAPDYFPGEDLPSGLYSVNSDYDYTTVPAGYVSGRQGHANGIEADDLVMVDSAFLPTYGSDWLTYDFTGKNIILTENFVIGYTPWCANDVTLTPVPEPATMLLLGFGLLGLAHITRRRNEK